MERANMMTLEEFINLSKLDAKTLSLEYNEGISNGEGQMQIIPKLIYVDYNQTIAIINHEEPPDLLTTSQEVQKLESTISPADTSYITGCLYGDIISGTCNLKPQIELLKGEGEEKENEKVHKCYRCNKEFDTFKDTLSRHKCNFICMICQKSFAWKNDLKRHEILHTGDKPYKCEVCDKTFADQSSRKRHQFTHDGVKPFQCGTCSKTFAHKQTLKRHENVHNTKSRTHECEVCHRTFALKQTLKRHQLLQKCSSLYDVANVSDVENVSSKDDVSGTNNVPCVDSTG